jgi:hypothetical protein
VLVNERLAVADAVSGRAVTLYVPAMQFGVQVDRDGNISTVAFFRVLCKGERGKEIMKGAIKDKLFPETLGWSKRVLEVPKISDRNYRQLRFMFNERRNIVADLHWGS